MMTMKHIFRRFLSLCVTAILLVSALPIGTIASDFSAFQRNGQYLENAFEDVPKGHPFEDNIKAAVELEIMQGYGNRFGVSDNLTRLDSIILACRIHSLYETGENLMTSYSGGDQYLQYAKAKGILWDLGNLKATITREEYVAVLSSSLPNEALSQISTVEDDAIPDVDLASVYAAAIYRLYRAGILTGADAQGRFFPKNSILRTEACAIATRMCDPSLRKTIVLQKNSASVVQNGNMNMDDEHFSEQWALYNDGSFKMEEEQNQFPVFETPFGVPFGPHRWSNPGVPFFGQAGSNTTTQTSAAGIDIQAKKAWSLYNGGKRDVVVAVIDTGVDYNHEDLKDSFWTNTKEIPNNGIDDDNNGYIDDLYGWNFYDGNNKVYASKDDDSHGTHGAGTICGSQNNGIGIAGIVNSSHVKIMVLKVLGGSDGTGTNEALLEAICYAEANGASICNMSFASTEASWKVQKAIANSAMLFVCASGNETTDIDTGGVYPAAYEYDNILSVANVASDGKLHSSSNYGKNHVDLAAPGTYILSTTPEGEYSYMSGTSMAAPMVTAAAAMLYSHYPQLTLADVRELLLRTTKSLPELSGKCVTGGMLDLGAAMEYDISKLSAKSWTKLMPSGSIPVIMIETSEERRGTVVTVKVTDADNNLVYTSYATGVHTAEEFAGTLEDTTFELSSDGTVSFRAYSSGDYTFFAVDKTGNEVVKTLSLTVEQNSGSIPFFPQGPRGF